MVLYIPVATHGHLPSGEKKVQRVKLNVMMITLSLTIFLEGTSETIEIALVEVYVFDID